MALRNCKECGNQISSKAKECPSCGKPIRGKRGKIYLAIIIIFFIPSFLSMVGITKKKSAPEPDTATLQAAATRKPPPRQKTPEEIRNDKIKYQFSAWSGKHVNLERYIKDAMNDPKSYEHVDTKYWDWNTHLIVKTTFRGKNGFGALVKNWVRAKVDLDGNIIEIIEQGQ